MSKMSLIAKLTIQDGKGSEMDAALAELVVAANEEAGLEIYSAHRDSSDENVYWFFELYTDKAAFETHGKGPIMKEAMAPFGDILAGPPEMHFLSPIAAKGLALG